MPELIDFIGTHIPQIAGVLIMAAIGAYLTEFNSRRSRFASAAEKFRNTILTELKGLYPIPSDWPKDFNVFDHQLREVFPNLQIAVASFRPFVTWYWRWAFDRVWFIYRLGKNGRGIDKQQYDQYRPCSGVEIVDGKEIIHDNAKIYRENFKRNVDNLLKFAKQK
ncbi:MAG: hypothetical protein ABIK92_09900 [Pseudomonadota bacterium]